MFLGQTKSNLVLFCVVFSVPLASISQNSEVEKRKKTEVEEE
jgi:hypothetical protein